MNFRLILPIIFFMATSGLAQAQITTTDPTTEIESKNEVYTLKGIILLNKFYDLQVCKKEKK